MTDQIVYMDAAAATEAGTSYKRRLLEMLAAAPGQTVVDLGCGPGTDLGSLRAAVGDTGQVIGVDRDPRMVEEARRRHPGADLRQGDLHELPLGDGTVDRVRVDRVLQHVTDPAAAISQARRVLRPGGLFGMAEPDWDTLAVADDDRETSRAFARFTAGQVRNPSMGRELVRLCAGAGLRVRAVEPVPVLFRDYAVADRILGLRRNSARAVEGGAIPRERAEAWLDRLAAGPVVAGFTHYLVVAQA
ncbi:methyltransferase domain-containing protein [Actinoplanes sp. M2I2]|uniref:methyltransferase domain-containing protein n=1 Tax=Actinoplanes sp. M2I2 TaxID=1734444 RepID=UPI002020BB7F|nr:methyltransferase domain-containing protein [Actinoplanes sp. M2I2]